MVIAVEVLAVPAGGEVGLGPHPAAGLGELRGVAGGLEAHVGDGLVLLVVGVVVPEDIVVSLQSTPYSRGDSHWEALTCGRGYRRPCAG